MCLFLSVFFSLSLSQTHTHTHTHQNTLPCSLTQTPYPPRVSDLRLLNVLCTSETTARTTRPALQSGFHMINHSSTVQQTRYNRSVYRQGNSPRIPLNTTVSHWGRTAHKVHVRLVVFCGLRWNYRISETLISHLHNCLRVCRWHSFFIRKLCMVFLVWIWSCLCLNCSTALLIACKINFACN